MFPKKFYPSLPFWTLFKKEVFRFLQVPIQTVLVPMLTASLYLFVFGFSLGRRLHILNQVSFGAFVIPGLILMGVIQNAFLNTASSLFLSRYIGNIVDLLVTPLTEVEFLMAYTLAAMIRGLIVGVFVLLVSCFFLVLPWPHVFYAMAFFVFAAFCFALFGLIAAIYSNHWEHLSIFTNFVLIPLVFLGGVFYPLQILPPFWESLSKWNPLVYFVDGFRYGALGIYEMPPVLSLGVSAAVSFGIFIWAWVLVKSGYHLRQ